MTKNTAAPQRQTPDPELLGQKDAAVRKSTGHAWRHWIRVLDDWGATEHTHTEIARYLREEHGVDGWWSQAITVGYERARGMRAKYETTAGFTANVSKTFPVPVTRLFAAFTDARQRNRWLERDTLTVRTTQKDRSARFDFREGGSRVVVGFDGKGPDKSTVYIQHEKLSGAEDVEEMRAMWKERLARLADLLRG